MNKKELLDDLFERWEKAHIEESDESCAKTIKGDHIKKHFFQRDGIINVPAFEKEKKKVLFISAEPNIEGYIEEWENWNGKSDYRDTYQKYHDDQFGHDEWRGKMKERLSALYGFITLQTNVTPHLLSDKFAVMDINKRGGEAKVGSGAHIVEYATLYRSFLRREIEIISPDIVVWVGTNTLRLGIPELIGAKSDGTKLYFEIEGKIVPIICVWQTSYYQAKIRPLDPEECGGINNKIIRKLCAKAKTELEKWRL